MIINSNQFVPNMAFPIHSMSMDVPQYSSSSVQIFFLPFLSWQPHQENVRSFTCNCSGQKTITDPFINLSSSEV